MTWYGLEPSSQKGYEFHHDLKPISCKSSWISNGQLKAYFLLFPRPIFHSLIPSSPPIYPFLPFPPLASKILCFWYFTFFPFFPMLERDSFYVSKSWSWQVLSSAPWLDRYRKVLCWRSVYILCVCFVSFQIHFLLTLQMWWLLCFQTVQ